MLQLLSEPTVLIGTVYGSYHSRPFTLLLARLRLMIALFHSHKRNVIDSERA